MPSFDLHREGPAPSVAPALLRVPDEEETSRALEPVTLADDRARPSARTHHRWFQSSSYESGEAHAWFGADVDDALQPTMPLRLLVDQEPDGVAFDGEHYGNEVRRSIRSDRRQPCHASGSEARSSLLLVHRGA